MQYIVESSKFDIDVKVRIAEYENGIYNRDIGKPVGCVGSMGPSGQTGPSPSSWIYHNTQSHISQSYKDGIKEIEAIKINNQKLITDFIKQNCKYVYPEALSIYLNFNRQSSINYDRVAEELKKYAVVNEVEIIYNKPKEIIKRLGIKSDKLEEYNRILKEMEEKNNKDKEKFDELVAMMESIIPNIKAKCTDRDYDECGLQFEPKKYTFPDSFYDYETYLDQGEIKILCHCGTDIYKKLLESGFINKYCKNNNYPYQ